jgi:hypothetical protein
MERLRISTGGDYADVVALELADGSSISVTNGLPVKVVQSDPATQTTLAGLVSANHTDLGALATKLDTVITALGTANSALAALVAGLPYHA